MNKTIEKDTDNTISLSAWDDPNTGVSRLYVDCDFDGQLWLVQEGTSEGWDFYIRSSSSSKTCKARAWAMTVAMFEVDRLNEAVTGEPCKNATWSELLAFAGVAR